MFDLQKKFDDMKKDLLKKLGLEDEANDLKNRLAKALEIAHSVGVDKVDVAAAGPAVVFTVTLHGLTDEQVKALVDVMNKKLHPEVP